MDDNKLYAIFWSLVAVVIVSIVAGTTFYNVKQEALIAKMPNPALYRCADDQRSQQTAFCVNLSQSK